MSEWNDFFAAQVGASAALAGLLFVAVSINLEKILKYPHLPTRALEALAALLCILMVSSFGLVPGQTRVAFGVETASTGLIVWMVQAAALLHTRDSGYETGLRYLFNQVPPLPFIVGGVLMALGHPSGPYWLVAGTLLCVISGVYYAWILLIEIQR